MRVSRYDHDQIEHVRVSTHCTVYTRRGLCRVAPEEPVPVEDEDVAAPVIDSVGSREAGESSSTNTTARESAMMDRCTVRQ